MKTTETMREYTRWWIAHPWHVTGTPESGKVPAGCDCGCQDRDQTVASEPAAAKGV